MTTPTSGQTPFVKLPDSTQPAGKKQQAKGGGLSAAKSDPPRLPSTGGSTPSTWSKVKAWATSSTPRATGLRTPLLSASSDSDSYASVQDDSKSTERPVTSKPPKSIDLPAPQYARPQDNDAAYFGATLGKQFAVDHYDDASRKFVVFDCQTRAVNTLRDHKGAARTELVFTCAQAGQMREMLGLPAGSSDEIRCDLDELMGKLAKWNLKVTVAELTDAIDRSREGTATVMAVHPKKGAYWLHVSRSPFQESATSGQFLLSALNGIGVERLKQAGYDVRDGGRFASGTLDGLAKLGQLSVMKTGQWEHEKHLNAVSRDKFAALLMEPKAKDDRFAIQVGRWPSEDVRCKVATDLAGRPQTKRGDPVVEISPRLAADEAVSKALAGELRLAGFTVSGDGRTWTGPVSLLPKEVTVFGDYRCFSGDEPRGAPPKVETPPSGATGSTTTSTTSTTSTTASTTTSSTSSTRAAPLLEHGAERARTLASHDGPVAMSYQGEEHEDACRLHDLRVVQAGDGSDVPEDYVLCRADAPIDALKSYIHTPKDTKASDGSHYYAVRAEFMKPLDPVPGK